MSLASALSGLQVTIDRWLAEADHVRPRVLDAGCGGQMYLALGEDIHIVGIDIDSKQLERNKTIHERILGDIQTFPLEPESFDLIICWDVLEHMRRPGLALENLRRATRTGGLLIIASPNVLSFKGLITKFTPYWFHLLYYRVHSAGFRGLIRRPIGGRPFKTFMRWTMSSDAVASWARQSSLVTEYLALYENPMQIGFRRQFGLTGKAWSTARGVVHALTRKRLDLESTDYIVALRR
jgi:SAM-dependent methyltransferase